MKDIEKFDVKPNVSQSTSKSRKSINSKKFLSIDANDDEGEKHAKRKSLIMDKNSPSTTTINSSTANTDYWKENKLSGDEITSHYGTCIKLASENKITQKNAFTLHLIDYLTQHLDGLKSFQIASSSLDAGSKIYAGRVDSVHQNTYHVLTGLGNKDQDEIEDTELINEPEEDAERVKKAARRRINKNLYPTDKSKIRISRSNFRADIDPLFQSEAEKFDDCGVGQLRLNNLQYIESVGELLLDSDTKVISEYDYRDCEPLESVLLDLSEYKEDIHFLITNKPLVLTDHFRDFKFTGWTPGSKSLDQNTVESFRSLMEEAKRREESEIYDSNKASPSIAALAKDICLGNDYMGGEDDGGGVGDAFGGGDDDDDEGGAIEHLAHEVKLEPADDDDLLDGTITVGTSKSDADGKVFVSSVTSYVNTIMDNHGEANNDYLGMWAGPEHWRKKAKQIQSLAQLNSTKNNMTSNGVSKPAKSRTQNLLNRKPLFPLKVETRINNNGHVRMVIPETEFKHFEKDLTNSTQLSEGVLNKNLKNEHVLPPMNRGINRSKKANYNSDWCGLDQMMNRHVSLVNKALQDWATRDDVDNDGIVMTGNNGVSNSLEVDEPPINKIVNSNGMVIGGGDGTSGAVQLTNAQQTVWIADDDGNVHIRDDGFMNNEQGAGPQDGNNNDDDDDEFGGIADVDAYMGASIAEITEADLADDDELTKVRLVDQVDINYAKTAKKINVRRLKTEIFHHLQRHLNITIKPPTVKESGQLPIMSQTTCLSQMLGQIDSKLSRDSDLSVPIVMTCLLHLANETGLCIESKSMDELMIGQGYCDDDLEQIRLCGQLDELDVNGGRKRTSITNGHDSGDQVVNKKQIKLEKGLFDDEDDEDEDGDEEFTNETINDSTGA